MQKPSYEIITIPNPILKQKAIEVPQINDDIKAQLDGMLDAMYAANGIGLAANQVGLLNRVLVMDVADEEGMKKEPIYMVNPQILWQSDEISTMDEGCLSIPQQYATVSRPAHVKVRYWDKTGREGLLEASGLLSHCVQHEIDHLDGVLFIDHLSALKRNMILRRFAKAQKGQKIL